MKVLSSSTTSLTSGEKVQLFFCGKSAFINEAHTAKKIATMLCPEAKEVCLIHPAPDQTGQGFQNVEWFRNGVIINADGVILSQSGACAVMQVAGCATVTFVNTENGQVGFSHVGRPALTPSCINNWRTILSTTLLALGFRTGNAVSDKVLALVTQPAPARSLCYEENPSLVESFITLQEQFPIYRLVDTGDKFNLDIFAVIKCILTEMYGFTSDNIVLYPIDEPTLSCDVAFRRRPEDAGLHNTVVVVR